jgi:integrase
MGYYRGYMPRTPNTLSDVAIKAAIRKAKLSSKATKKFDGDGLFLLVKPSGVALWRFKYIFGVKIATTGKRKGKPVGIEKLIGFGSYSDVPLKLARERKNAARELVERGIDPSALRKTEKLAKADSVEAIALEYFGTRTDITDKTRAKDFKRLKKYIFPSIGKRPISAVEPPELLTALRRVEALKILETAHRTLAVCGRVWRYAIATGRATRDITSDLRGALQPVVVTSFAAITDPKKLGELLRAIDGYSGQPMACAALKLGPMLFTRPGELRLAEWSEFQMKGAEPTWRIPKERMKMRKELVVPLPRQAVAILLDLHALTGDGRYLFPSLRSGGRPMSDNTINAALRRLGYSGDEQVAHGFRSTASTLLNELGWNPDAIELQLAHTKSDVRGIYNRSVLMRERREMMQAWADHLDSLRADAGAIPD